MPDPLSEPNAPNGPSDAAPAFTPASAFTKRTLAAQAMGHVDPVTRAVVAPLHVSTTFLRDPDNGYSSGFSYARPDNATVREAEAVLAMLEDAAAGALLFGSGMAAATAVFTALEPGDHVVAPRVMYWGLKRWLNAEMPRRRRSAQTRFGSVSVNALPAFISLSTVTSPPSISLKALVSDRPSPVPPNFRVVEASAC